MAKTNYFRAVTVSVGMLAAAVLTTLVMAVPAWAASNVFVTDVSPDGGATSVAADSNITAQFGKAMRASTIKGSTFYLKKQGSSTKIPAQVSYSGISKTATLNPESNLEAGTTYTATVKGGRRGVRASDGGKLGGTSDGTATFANGKVTWSFTVAEGSQPPENTPPTVSSVVPSHGATGVATSTNVTATFSEAMDSGTITGQSFTLAKRGSSPVSAQVTYDENSRTATLNPTQDLEAGTDYDAKVTTTVEDLAGNAMVQEKTWTFKTLDSVADSVAITPNPLHFSWQELDPLWCTGTKNLTVTNNSPDDVTFAGVSITGPDASNFSDGARTFIVRNGPFTVLAGNHFFDPVTFTGGGTPEDNQRTYSATLTYKDETGATIGDPVTLSAETECLTFP